MSNFKDSIKDWYAIANKGKPDESVKPKKDFKIIGLNLVR